MIILHTVKRGVITRGAALLLALLIIVSFLPSTGVVASAAGESYLYNTGERGAVATALSPSAVAFYERYGASYQTLSSYAGGRGAQGAPTSALYSALQSLMVRAHTRETSYEQTKDLYQYTDCEGGGGAISSFYSGKAVGPTWDGSFNREHTWPNSKGLNGSDENDIMMLRPTSTSENSSRGNKAYGESSGYYHPNAESGGAYDLRGDVARIFLYVYVRWGNVNGNGSYDTWGADGVFESVAVLLDWIAADPVDTWELGRNDSVQSITGTRNIFVDYPELAYLLFGEQIPDGIKTPSGEGNARCAHDNYDRGVAVSATCTQNGYTLYTCQTAGCNGSYKDSFVSALGHSYTAAVTAPTCTKEGYTAYSCTRCSYSYTGDKVAAKGHSYEDGVCAACGAVKSVLAEATVSFADDSHRLSFSATQQVWEQNGVRVTNNKASASSNVANYVNPVRFYKGSDVIVSYTDITKIEIDCTGISASYVSGWMNAPAGTSVSKSGSIVTVVLNSPADSVTFTNLSSQSRAKSITVFTNAKTPAACTHKNKTVSGVLEPTCTTDGHSGVTLCLDCGTTVDEGEVIEANGHRFAAASCEKPRTCSVCFATEGEALGHDWSPATEDAPKTCARCGKTEGEALPDSGEAPDEGETPDGGEAPDDGETPDGGKTDHAKCTAGPLQTLWNMICNFFRRLFGRGERCVCGKLYNE